MGLTCICWFKQLIGEPESTGYDDKRDQENKDPYDYFFSKYLEVCYGHDGSFLT